MHKRDSVDSGFNWDDGFKPSDTDADRKSCLLDRPCMAP